MSPDSYCGGKVGGIERMGARPLFSNGTSVVADGTGVCEIVAAMWVFLRPFECLACYEGVKRSDGSFVGFQQMGVGQFEKQVEVISLGSIDVRNDAGLGCWVTTQWIVGLSP